MMKSAKIKDLFVIDTSSKILAKEAIIKGKYPFYTSGGNVKLLDSFQFNTRGIVIGKGGNPNWHFADGMFSISSDCCLLKSKQEYVDVKYAYYYLCAKPSLLDRLYKGAGIKHISIDDIRDIQIDFPEPSVQQMIVTIMSFLDDIIEKRKAIIDKMSDVLLSYYLAVTDKANGIEEYKIKDISSDIKSGPYGSQLLISQIKEEGEIYVLGMDDIKDNFIVKKERLSYLPMVEFSKFKRFLVKESDVLVSIMGSLGYSSVVPRDFGVAINTKHLADITPIVERCNPYFLSYALRKDPHIKNQIMSRKRGAIMAGLTLADLKSITVKLPTIKAQKLFGQVYCKYNSIEKDMKKELSLLEDLRVSLLNEFFLKLQDSLSDRQESYHADDGIGAIVRLIEQGGFNNLANYDEMRKMLYEYLDKGLVIQSYDQATGTIKLHIDETHKS